MGSQVAALYCQLSSIGCLASKVETADGRAGTHAAFPVQLQKHQAHPPDHSPAISPVAGAGL